MIKSTCAALLTLSGSVIFSSSAGADNFSGTDFSLRFPTALNHFEPYADVAASGGASAASLFGSSENPAAIAWLFPDPAQSLHSEIGVSGQYSNVSFDNGTQLNFSSATLTMGTKESGVFRIDVGFIESNERQVRDLPAAFDFSLAGARLNYSKRFDDFSVGATAGFAHSETEFKAPLFDLVDSNKDIWDFRLGALWRPTGTKWLLGLNTAYIYGPTDTTYLTPSATGLAQRSVGDATHQFTLQPGIAYEYATNALIHLDYQLGYFTNDTGNLTENRFMAGTDIKIAEFFYLRAGAFVDTEGSAGWTAGLGFYPSRHLFVDLAYQNNNFPEIAQEFGRSRTLNASVSVQW